MDNTVLLRSEAELVINEARRRKSERTKTLGQPIQLTGKALDIHIEGNAAWIAENTHVAKKIDLESGNILQIYKGHTAPVTCLAFFKSDPAAADRVLISGSWDKASWTFNMYDCSIKLWNTDTKALICSTAAHDDFVKCLFALPIARLLVSSSSDKTIRFWDLADVLEGKLKPAGSISAHSRPVECLAGVAHSETSVILITADTMGIIKIWKLERESGPNPRWRSELQDTLDYHRTGITEILYGAGQIWTASSDETVQITSYPDPALTRPIPPLNHPRPVRAVLPLSLTPLAEPYAVTAYGDVIRLYDLSIISEPEILGEIDAHWHDVTAVRLWMRTSKNEAGQTRIEPWIVSTSLDGTIRKWRFSQLAASTLENPAGSTQPVVITPVPEPAGDAPADELTEEEERELAELMGEE
ncbi:WD40-repeat-containing domain protein [Boletus edulis]|nr:WD40-repeat-containing domain protein [Boletus edulis]